MFRSFLLFAIASATSLLSFSQSSYTDSINKYQFDYKKDLYAVIQKDTAFVKFYPINSSYKVIARVEKVYGQSFFPMSTTDGKSKQAIKYAALKFDLHGKEYTLYAYQLSFLLSNPEHKNDFFVPFTDETSGIESYGGGRYMDFTQANITAGNTLLIDFNKSYNPYCAFKIGYSCPIPPKENELKVEIKAGEMNFGKSSH